MLSWSKRYNIISEFTEEKPKKKVHPLENILNEVLIQEGKPVGGKDDGGLKYVFKLPDEGKFTAEFHDGTSVEIDVDKEDKSSGNYAFVGKKNGRIFKTWEEKPSKEEANEVLQRVKAFS